MTAARKKKTRKMVGVPILERTIGLLEFLSRCPAGVALSDLARELKVPKNTVYRMLNTLCAHGYVERDEGELGDAQLSHRPTPLGRPA